MSLFALTKNQSYFCFILVSELFGAFRINDQMCRKIGCTSKRSIKRSGGTVLLFPPIYTEGVNCRLQVAGAGCRLQVAGCRLQVAGCRCRLQVAGCRCRLQVAGCRCRLQVQVAGCRLRLYFFQTEDV